MAEIELSALVCAWSRRLSEPAASKITAWQKSRSRAGRDHQLAQFTQDTRKLQAALPCVEVHSLGWRAEATAGRNRLKRLSGGNMALQQATYSPGSKGRPRDGSGASLGPRHGSQALSGGAGRELSTIEPSSTAHSRLLSGGVH